MRGVILMCFCLQLAACAAQQPASTTSSAAPAGGGTVSVSSTSDVLERHMKTFGANDLEGVLADYAPNAVMYTPGGAVKGSEALRKQFQAVLAEWGKPGVKFDLKQKLVEGEGAYTYWNAETADNIYEGATDSFVVRDGKIVEHFFAGKITPKK